MPVGYGDYMDYGLWYHDNETGEDHPVDMAQEATTTITEEHVRNPEINVEYHGMTVNFKGICQNEQCLPEDAESGDVWRIQDSRDRWIWTGFQWELLDTWYAEPEAQVHDGNETAPVLVNGDYMYMPDNDAARVVIGHVGDNQYEHTVTLDGTYTFQNPLEETAHDVVGYTWTPETGAVPMYGTDMTYTPEYFTVGADHTHVGDTGGTVTVGEGWDEYRAPETATTATTARTVTIEDIPDERVREMLERIRDGAAFNFDNLAELRNVEGARHSFVTDDDNTTYTPQEEFEEIFEVGA